MGRSLVWGWRAGEEITHRFVRVELSHAKPIRMHTDGRALDEGFDLLWDNLQGDFFDDPTPKS